MAFTLRVYFVGMTAFVEEDGVMKVFFVNVNRPELLKIEIEKIKALPNLNEQKENELEGLELLYDHVTGDNPYQTIVQIESAYRKAGETQAVKAGGPSASSPVDQETNVNGMAHPFEQWELKDHFMNVQGIQNDDLQTNNMSIGNAQIPATPHNAESLQWVMPTPDTDQSIGKIKGYICNIHKQPKPIDDITGYMFIQDGEVSPAGFASNLGDHALFDLGVGGTRALASVIAWDVQVSESFATINLHSYGNHPNKHIHLAPIEGQSVVEVWMLNRQKSAVLEHQDNNVEGTRQHIPYMDYFFYYNLLESPPEEKHYVRLSLENGNNQMFQKHQNPQAKPVLKKSNNTFMNRRYFRSIVSEGAIINPSSCPCCCTRMRCKDH